jgi:protein phosphatase
LREEEEDDLHAWGGPGFDEEGDFRAGGTDPRSTTGSPGNGSRGNAGGGRRGRRNQFDDDEYDAPRAKRRWPIVSGILVLLVLVVAGGLVAGWQYVQGQYYIGEHNGNVAIFRGVDQDVAGINLSSLVQGYPSLPVSLLVSGDQAQVSQTISYSSQQKAQTVVSQLQQSVSQCRQGYAALTAWQAQNTSYQQALTSYSKLPAAQKRTAKKPTPPPAEPAVPSAAKCAPASAFGIPASALPGW